MTIAEVALVAAACGGASASTSPPTTPAGGTSAPAAGVHVVREPGVGPVLVDAAGRTLYLFAPDRQVKATCTGSCASAWPPLTVSGAPVAGRGVTARRLGTVKDADGATQVTYNRWPLYTFVEDTGPGQAHGQGVVSFGGRWSTLTAQGQPPASSASSTTSSGGGNGY